MSIVLRLQIGKSEPLLRGADHFWRVMRSIQAASGPFSVSAVHACSNDRRASVSKYIRSLVVHGYVEECPEVAINAASGKAEKLYRIVRDQAATPRLSRRQSSGQQNMWNVLRGPMGRDGVTFRDLAAFASTETTPIAPETAKSYLLTLANAGYLATPGGKGRPGHPTVWRLKPSMDTGPKPPMILRSKMVYDQNTARVVGEVLAEEDRP